jgi:ADP-ribosylglycohydrolase
VGSATRIALLRLKQGAEPTEAGGKGEYDNGNGSLMRILPLAYYLQHIQDTPTRFGMIHDVSAITHAHPRSQVACGIYIQYALHLLNGATPRDAYEQTQRDILDYYREAPYSDELAHFERLLRQDISGYAEEEIHSSTYVVHTLEAALWCLLRHDSSRSTVLAAVNLGDDTDTTGALAGGLAGIVYGFEAIPEAWRKQLARKDEILDLAQRLAASLKEQELPKPN